MTIHYMKEQSYKMGFSETDTCTPCSQNITGTYLYDLWRCTSQSSTFELRSLNNYIILWAAASPQLCIPGDLLSIHLQESNASILPNYRQEGYIFKLEMKELYKHCAMEKSSSRSYIPGKKSASLYRKTSEFNQIRP